ncbi:Ribosomal RNA large subunit methyltransferase J [Ceratobasidium theobromae]|uniref:Ribosomal RNA large subunit methyltransferase J n=1 Tax=Ceratobasidium theobromae TaxID=1582974 RepID=A0A5N5QJS1_9AGAM|nr:Ribosomal RNA large subunit methyltransferase J [Ceratobasidium theobromae]
MVRLLLVSASELLLTMPATYTPPHLRGSDERLASRLPQCEFEDTRTMGPALHYFYTHSPPFQRCRQMKRRYGDNEVVNQKFAHNRERSRVDDSTLAPMFRDQFYTAFGDMVEDLGGPECLLVPNPTTGAARFVRKFADLGCAPGGFAQYLLTTFPQSTGIGITHPDGYTMTYQGWSNGMQQRFPVHFADLTASPGELAARVLPDAELPITPPDSPSRQAGRSHLNRSLCDVVIAGAILCNDRTRQGQPVERAARPLLAFAQLRVALSMLAPGGTLILVSSANPNVFCLEILALIRRLFTAEVRSTKGRKLHEIRSAYYIVGQGYKGINQDVLRQLDEAIRTLKQRGTMSSGASDWSDDDDVAYTGEASGSSPVAPVPIPLLLHPHLTEVDILRSDGSWLLSHYEPLWSRQADALERALARVKSSSSGDDRTKSWRRSGAFELDSSSPKITPQSQPRSRTQSQRAVDEQYAAMVHSFEAGLAVGAPTRSSRRPRAEERWM